MTERLNANRRRCPCCWRLVHRTMTDTIEGHWDNAGGICPAGFHPYSITMSYKPKQVAA